MAQNYNGGGAYLRNVPVGMQTDGTGPDAASLTAFFAAIEPVAGTWVAVSIAAQPDAPRNVTFTITDANSSITGATLEVIGTDAQDRALEETISTSSAGTQTVVGARCFKTITSARYIVSGVVTGGADLVQGGYGDILGIPYAIAAVSDVMNRRQDANAGVGTISIPTGTHGTWTLSGGNVPNGTRLYYADIWSSAD
jgi:hypothetical protein